MSEATAAPTPDADEQALARLAALDLAAVEKAHAKLMAADAAAEVAELGRTYQRLARSLRQTLALKAKLKREREADAAVAKAARPPAGPAAVARRTRQLRAAVTRVIWSEAEPDEALDFEEALDVLISAECSEEGFCAEPLEDQVVRIATELGFSPETAERWRWLGDGPLFPDAETPPDHESSA